MMPVFCTCNLLQRDFLAIVLSYIDIRLVFIDPTEKATVKNPALLGWIKNYQNPLSFN